MKVKRTRILHIHINHRITQFEKKNKFKTKNNIESFEIVFFFIFRKFHYKYRIVLEFNFRYGWPPQKMVESWFRS